MRNGEKNKLGPAQIVVNKKEIKKYRILQENILKHNTRRII